ncbi:mCG1041760 [Mus musculus]|nr:mCG1041760 [Mus musculus]
MGYKGTTPEWKCEILIYQGAVPSGPTDNWTCWTEAVKTGQKILIEQQESMWEEEKGLKRKRKKKGDTVLPGGQKGQNKRAEVEEEGELASAPPPYASSAATYRWTTCPEIWREDNKPVNRLEAVKMDFAMMIWLNPPVI